MKTEIMKFRNIGRYEKLIIRRFSFSSVRPKIGQCKSRGSYSDEQLAMHIEAMTLNKQAADKRPLIQQRTNFGSEPILPGGSH